MNVDVAKAIGWTPFPDEEGDTWWYPPTGPKIRRPLPTYTVDGLLAWLRDHDWWMYECYPDPAGGGIPEQFDISLYHWSEVGYPDDPRQIDHARQFLAATASTLIEALERAVLAVNKETAE